MMDFHILGKLPSKKHAPAGEGVSLAVFQFMELVRGQRARKEPVNPFRVVTLQAEEIYCLSCCGVRWFDIARDDGMQVRWRRCRGCGKEGEG